MYKNATRLITALALVVGTAAVTFDVTSASAAGWGRGQGYNSQAMKQGWRGPRFGNRSNQVNFRNGNRGKFAGRRGIGYLSMMEQFDSNGDGALTKSEMSTGLKSYFTTNDKNGDQAITLDEFQPRWRTMSDEMKAQAFKRRDRNSDGKITLSEMTSPALAMFKRRDVNNDNKLDNADCPQCRTR